MPGPTDALKVTLRFGAPGGPAVAAVPSTSATLSGIVPSPVDLGETVVADSDDGSASVPTGTPSATSAGRSTVLPRRRPEGAAAVDERPRFDVVRMLGEGGMGQVELVRDNDIRRTVAVKRLHADDQSGESLLRFADEVRIVGQLEHPAIVPVYDVGRDAAGQVYLVMKHLNGETMESIIAKLAARDPAYTAKYTIEYRVHLFLQVLDALRYAHARGVIHRDLKPANVMIGPFGEVTVLDWGIAKPIRRAAADSGSVEPLARTLVDTHDKRLQETQLGSLAGTPLYMSPEQAAGRNDDLDERSDVYSLCVLFYEWLTLEHPLKEKRTVTEVLAAIISGEIDPKELGRRATLGGTPGEWANVVVKGLVRDRDKRTQSVDELERQLRAVMDGQVRIECHVTFTKRTVHEVLHFIDRHPKAYFVTFYAGLAASVLGLGYAGYALLRAAF